MCKTTSRYLVWLMCVGSSLTGCIEEQRAREAAEAAVDQASLITQVHTLVSLCDAIVTPATDGSETGDSAAWGARARQQADCVEVLEQEDALSVVYPDGCSVNGRTLTGSILIEASEESILCTLAALRDDTATFTGEVRVTPSLQARVTNTEGTVIFAHEADETYRIGGQLTQSPTTDQASISGLWCTVPEDDGIDACWTAAGETACYEGPASCVFLDHEEVIAPWGAPIPTSGRQWVSLRYGGKNRTASLDYSSSDLGLRAEAEVYGGRRGAPGDRSYGFSFDVIWADAGSED